MRRVRAALAALLLMFAATAAPALAAAPRLNFSQVQGDFMCTVCHEPLNVAQSPEAYNEDAELKRLIATGDTRAQVRDAMVAEYGIQVLSKPPAHGFNLVLYVLPPVVVAAGLAFVVFTIPRLRRRRSDGGDGPVPTALSPEDAQRLDADLARHL